MAEIDANNPLHVNVIHFTNGDTLEDKIVFVAGGFLIVEADAPEQMPTWYNLQTVQALQEVTIDGRQGRPQPRIIRWL